MADPRFIPPEDLPCAVRVIEHTMIPLPDGTRLAAKLWIPQGAEETPVPAIFEFIPYRKRDFMAHRDSITHGYFAGHGYACVRVDLRGSGESEGVLRDEYLQQELDDAVAVLDWIAAQSWCNGRIGMMGISWGGFNALQVAALQPEPLKAIITLSSTDDRYADDVHYMGGCLLSDNLSWASTMFAYNACPPDPVLMGEDWRERWLERLRYSGLWIQSWLEHQHRDAYWQHGSICEDYARIQTPVLAVSGWADGYSNAVFRMLEHLDVPRQGLVGAWGHQYPHLTDVHQGIDFLGRCLRWWDRYLGGQDNGVDEEPMLLAWMQDSISPTATISRPGRWVGEDEWPSPQVTEQVYTLAAGRLDAGPPPEEPEETELSVQSPLSVGNYAGKWCSYSIESDLPSDQREEDGGSLNFETPPLEEDLEILGAPVVELEIAVDKPVAQVAVRLSNVYPDDRTTRVTYGLLNLTHRDSHAEPSPLEPHHRYRVQVQLNDVGQTFRAGHRIRLSISTSYWPLAWPAPEDFRLRVFLGKSSLRLPLRLDAPRRRAVPPMGMPVGATPVQKRMIEPANREWFVHHDLARNCSSLTIVNDAGKSCYDAIDWTVNRRVVEKYTYEAYRPNSVRGEVQSERSFRRGDFHIRTYTRTWLTSTPTHFHIAADLDAYEGDRRVFSHTWDTIVERDLV